MEHGVFNIDIDILSVSAQHGFSFDGSLEKSSDHNQSIFSPGSIGEWKKKSIFAIILS